ncbi:ATP-binding cassette domain-containing protein [Roseateles sp. BYS180W]|uniref:ATP-binding cassette domain-containing protein n=1 Tax=Roseateles rivi TaxID=3299028 RepID=A0ABW7FX02_9BURK
MSLFDVGAGSPGASAGELASPPLSLLEAQSVTLRAGAAPTSLSLRPGQLLGLAGLEGQGQEAFLETLAGWRRPHSGRVIGPRGAELRHLRDAAAQGVAYLPRDRRASGIFPTLSIMDNFAMATLGQDVRLGWISHKARRQRYEQMQQRLDIVARDAELPITALSGGNQQKVLLARLLALAPRVLLLNDPTRGVDVATRQLLYRVLGELAAQGMSLVILSTEVDEVCALCEEVLVFREGSVSAHLQGADTQVEAVMAAMFGRKA